MKIIVTSCILYVYLHQVASTFYDNDYRHVHYDDDPHVLYDTCGFIVPSNVWLQPTNPTMMGLGGV